MWRERHGAFATEPRRVPSSIRTSYCVNDSSARSVVRHAGRHDHFREAAAPLLAGNVVGDLLLTPEASVVAVYEDVGINQHRHAGAAPRVARGLR